MDAPRLGGVVATGLGGPQQFGYGRPRGSVIGMKVVLADGSVIKAGGRVVKNVAGYDCASCLLEVTELSASSLN